MVKLKRIVSFDLFHTHAWVLLSSPFGTVSMIQNHRRWLAMMRIALGSG
jgi:hypothetical protein